AAGCAGGGAGRAARAPATARTAVPATGRAVIRASGRAVIRAAGRAATDAGPGDAMAVLPARHPGYTPPHGAGLTGHRRVLAPAGLSPVAGIDEAGRGAC